MHSQNKALIFRKIPTGLPVPGEHLTIEPVPFDDEAPAPEGGITVQVLYASLDPYMRGRMRAPEVKSYSPPFDLNKPVTGRCIAEVVKSNNSLYQPGDLVIGFLPIQQYCSMSSGDMGRISLLQNPLGIEDIRVFLEALGMPGLTAYASLREIRKPKKGETIFVSSAAGTVGQVVGQLAKHEGLRVVGSVGSDAKLDYIVNELGFDGGFNYKKDKPADALARLAPDGIDIYYDNVGGEQLDAALAAMNDFDRVVVCGMISQYNLPPDQLYGVKNILNFVSKRLTMRGFIVGDPGFGDKWANEHTERVSAWIKDGSLKVVTSETVGIDNE